MARNTFQPPPASDSALTPMHQQTARTRMQKPQPRKAEPQLCAQAAWRHRPTAVAEHSLLQAARHAQFEAGSQWFCHLRSLGGRSCAPSADPNLKWLWIPWLSLLLWAPELAHTFLCKISFSRSTGFACHNTGGKKNIKKIWALRILKCYSLNITV